MDFIKRVVLMVALCFSVACSDGDDDFVLAPQDIVGVWIGNTSGDIVGGDTQDSFFLSFDGATQIYSIAVDAVEGDDFSGTKWVDDPIGYVVDGNDVLVVNENKTFVMTVESIEDDLMYYYVKYYEVGGDIIKDDKPYVAKRVVESSVATEIVGSWYWEAYNARYEYRADGSYTRTNMADGSQNEGSYELYGDTMVSEWQYTDDAGGVVDCVVLTVVDIDGDTMSWEAIKDGVSVSSTLIKES